MPFKVYVREAWHELRAGLSGSLVPLMIVALMGYVFSMLTSAQYMQNIGGAGVHGNSSLAIFQIDDPVRSTW